MPSAGRWGREEGRNEPAMGGKRTASKARNMSPLQHIVPQLGVDGEMSEGIKLKLY